MAPEIFGSGADIHLAGIWPLFKHGGLVSKGKGLSHGWTGGVYIAVKPLRVTRAAAGGKKDKPSAGLEYKIKLQSPEIGMLLA